MCHSGLMISKNFRGSSSGTYRSCTAPRRGSNAGADSGISGAREYFYFDRHKIRTKFQSTSRILSMPSRPEYLPKAIKNDFDFLRKIIGEDLALKILKVDQFKTRIVRKECTHFTLYSGENKQGKKVALLELF